MEQNTILFCEPQCWGFEHAFFNSALLETIHFAFSDKAIIFMGEKQHFNEVYNILRDYNADCLEQITFKEILIPERQLADWARLRKEFRWCKEVIGLAQQIKSPLIILSSITNTGLLALKISMLRNRLDSPVLAIPHSCLYSLLATTPRRPWKWRLSWFLRLRNVLALPSPRSLKLVALGDSIYHWVNQAMPKNKTQWVVLDLPYLWPKMIQSEISPSVEKITFGYFGVSKPGFEIFCQLAEEILSKYKKVQFSMVGFVDRTEGLEKYLTSQVISDLSLKPLSQEEFRRRAMSLTYCISTLEPHWYRLVASASFLDSLAYLKPGIFRRNPYIEYYFDKLGDIGYLYDNYDELREIVIRILENFPYERYCQQVENILKGRIIFEPRNLALRLREDITNISND